MRPLFVFGFTIFLILCLISDCRHSEAAGRGPCCIAGQCEAPILLQAVGATRECNGTTCHMRPTLQRVEGQPVRNVVRWPARRLFRWVRGCN